MAAALLILPCAATVGACIGQRRIHHDRPDDTTPLPTGVAWRSFVAECFATAAVMATWMLRPRPVLRARAPAQGIAVLLPDAGLHGGAFRLFRRRLHRCGWHSVVGVHHIRLADIDTAVAELDWCVREHSRLGTPVVLIGHGTGGLVARHYLRRQSDDTIRHLVTLGTPHQGTEARKWPTESQQVHPGSTFLTQLGESDTIPENFDVIAIHSDFDARLIPAEAAYYPGAFNIQVRGVGHIAMLTSPKIFDLVAENLNAGATAHRRLR